METIHAIEQAIKGSDSAVREIENRRFLKRILGTTNRDLVEISRSQNTINTLFLGLIREVITLNIMGYSFLAAVLREFDQMVRDGWRDQEGRLQRLSEEGKELAFAASDMFHTMLHGARETHRKLESVELEVEQLRIALQKQDADLAAVKQLQSRAWIHAGLLCAFATFVAFLVAVLILT